MAAVGIIGAGTWGTALAVLLNNNGHDVTIWSAFDTEIQEMSRTRRHKNLPEVVLPDQIQMTADLRTAMAEKDMLIMAVTIPTWINMLLRTYAWMNLLSDNGIINGLLSVLGINPVTMMYTNFSVVVGMVCNFMPFMIIPIHTSLRKMDNSLIEAAMDLGANPFQTFQKVVLKLSMPGVINGIVMVFLMVISSFVIPKLLGGGQFVLIGNLIESQFVSVGDWNFGSAISLILAVLILVAMRLMKKMDVQDN